VQLLLEESERAEVLVQGDESPPLLVRDLKDALVARVFGQSPA